MRSLHVDTSIMAVPQGFDHVKLVPVGTNHWIKTSLILL